MNKYNELRNALFELTHEGDSQNIEELENGDLAITAAVFLMKDNIGKLEVERDEALSRVGVLEKRIEYAMNTANGRWDEWGSRAESVCLILEGEDPYADQGEEGS